jgi:exonuclease III
MDPEMVQKGRSYGGIGFICKKSGDFIHKSIDIDSDRISIIQLCNIDKPLFTVIGVYMPFYSGSQEQIALYLETIDLLQSILDTYAADMPVMIVGDFNASLPQQQSLSVNWHKSRPFNHNSVI